MKRQIHMKLAACAIGGLLLAASVVASGQSAGLGQAHAVRAAETAANAQERASRAHQTASSATERASSAQERASQAQERASQAQERSAAAQQRSDRASEAVRRAGRENSVSAGAQRSRGLGIRERHGELAAAHPQALELLDGVAAVRGEVLSIDPSPAVIGAARRAGFSIIADETIPGIDLRYVTFGVPVETSLKAAMAKLRDLAPATEFSANHIHLQSGSARKPETRSAGLAPSARISGPAVGLIDGGVAATAAVPQVAQRGFAAGAPAPDAHATALASLLAGERGVKSAAPGAPLLVADVYGRDPRGGSAVALARALGWMATQQVPVLVIALVGPSNPIVARAVERVQERGTTIVAPVGNAGAAAPPMFPAAYPGVVGVTGVDRRNRALVEAGRGPHVDYAAPAADIFGAGLNGSPVRLRGTSYAAPLVAGRLWAARSSGRPLAALQAEAADLGRRGRDNVFGNGLVCGGCR